MSLAISEVTNPRLCEVLLCRRECFLQLFCRILGSFHWFEGDFELSSSSYAQIITVACKLF